jgi:hypothetical protein
MPESAREAGYFQPNSLHANFAYWAKLPEWTGEEAASLILGLNPNIMADLELNYGTAAQYAAAYNSLENLASRAIKRQHIPYPHTPVRWLTWAKKCNLPIPPALEEEILRWDGVSGSAVSADRARIVELEAQIAELTAKADIGSSGTTVAPDVGTRERDSMLTLIIAMAVMGYRFNPAAKRSDSIKDIVSDIEKCGLSLSDDTVRRYLREGMELLPPQENQGS